jgi:hypothetical protein
VASRSILAAGVGAALVLAACGTDRELTEPEPVPVTEERLAEALVESGDLPEGYATVDGEGTPVSTEIVPEHECDDRIGELEPEESVSRDFTQGDVTFNHTVSWYPGQGGAVAELYRDVGADCSQAVADDGVAIRAFPLDFGVLSDDTLPIAFEIEPDSGPILERDLVIMRQGDLVSVLRLEGPRPSDKVLLDGAARVAIGYLGLLHDDTT